MWLEKLEKLVFGEEPRRKRKRNLNDAERKALHKRAGGRCENPGCNIGKPGKKLTLDDMEAGHMRAHSKGGSATLANSKCLCHGCNKKQGTMSWPAFLKSQDKALYERTGGRVEEPKGMVRRVSKEELSRLQVSTLRKLATYFKAKPKGTTISNWPFEDKTLAPTKSQYVNKLATAFLPKAIGFKEADLKKWIQAQVRRVDRTK